jgi:hypothetical protein
MVLSLKAHIPPFDEISTPPLRLAPPAVRVGRARYFSTRSRRVLPGLKWT